ncbi:IS4 family transposase [Legionella yabuuchiae]|uniref:IS4 family transposase n=1 Tax=Legionella yabuuchiae TaxID=376727 RepID=UPI001F5EC561|nr:IS4 family transposase [Legionella yabuuchiae]
MEINVLRDMLNGYFKWNKARMDCFVCMLVALLRVRTVNLSELASGFMSKAQETSRYKRIKRFIKEFEIDYSMIASWAIGVFGLSGQSLFLSIERTNWRWGKADINILMLSIVYKGIGIPLFWKLLPKQTKRGNSNTTERITIMKRFIKCFGQSMIAGLLGDREFVGNDWFSWLLTEKIPFCIRIKGNVVTTNARGLAVDIQALLYDLKPGEQRVLKDKRKLWKQLVYLSALRLPDGELLIVATDTLLEDPIKHYGKRWEIETLFSCLKSRGFNFEDTHIIEAARIERLLALLTVAFCWCHKTGEWRHEQKAIKIKKHGRKAISYFRYGLDLLRDAALNGAQNVQQFFGGIFEFLRVEPNTRGAS